MRLFDRTVGQVLISTDVATKPGRGNAISLGVCTGIAVAVIFGPVACIGLAGALALLSGLLPAPDLLTWGSPLVVAVGWYIGTIGSLVIGIPVSIVLIRLGIAGWWTYGLSGFTSAWVLAAAFVGNVIVPPPIVLLYSTAYGLLFWIALRWIMSSVLRYDERWG